MRSASTALLMMLLLSCAPAKASPYEGCSDSANTERQIRACSEIVNRGDQETLRNRTYAYYNRGLAYYNKGQFDRAIADYDRSLTLNPTYAIAYNNRGLAFDSIGKYDRAIADYTRSIQLNPRYAIAYYNRANAFGRKQRYSRAIAEYGQALKRAPRYAKAYSRRGYTHYMTGNYKAAVADLQKRLELEVSGRAILFRYLARWRAGAADGDELKADAARLADQQWPYAAIELLLGRRTPEATLAAARSPVEQCQASFYIGQWYLLRQRQISAVKALKAAVAACPGNLTESRAARAELKRL